MPYDEKRQMFRQSWFKKALNVVLHEWGPHKVLRIIISENWVWSNKFFKNHKLYTVNSSSQLAPVRCRKGRFQIFWTRKHSWVNFEFIGLTSSFQWSTSDFYDSKALFDRKFSSLDLNSSSQLKIFNFRYQQLPNGQF